MRVHTMKYAHAIDVLRDLLSLHLNKGEVRPQELLDDLLWLPEASCWGAMVEADEFTFALRVLLTESGNIAMDRVQEELDAQDIRYICMEG